MRHDELDSKMRALECFHDLRLLPGTWTVIRVDGRGFSKFTEARFEKPFDPRFHAHMVHTAQELLTDLQGLYAYTESDEISILFGPEWTLFDREVEKLVSISASIATAAFALSVGERAHFDSRLWSGVNPDRVVDYFRWRQSDASRCALNGHCYWMLRKEGLSARRAGAMLQGKDVAFKNELLFERGINYNEDVPLWQRRGTGLFWESYEKEGFNPKTGQTVMAQRRRVCVDEALPMKDAYGDYLRDRLAEA